LERTDEPLYPEMFLCAKTVHWFIVDALCRWSNEKWYERTKLNKKETWIDWEHLVFYFLRHPRKTEKAVIAKNQTVEFNVFVNYKTTSSDTTLKNIYHNNVNITDYSFEELLLFNNIQLSYLSNLPGGTKIDEERLKDQLIFKGIATPTAYSYSIIQGNNILIPIKNFYKSKVLGSETWYTMIAKLDQNKWGEFIRDYQESRDSAAQVSASTAEDKESRDPAAEETNTEHPLKQLIQWNYVDERKRDDKIAVFAALRSKLEEKYNKSPGQPL
jgi:hypothetical protein